MNSSVYSLRSWRCCGRSTKMKVVEPRKRGAGVVCQFPPPHSPRGFAAQTSYKTAGYAGYSFYNTLLTLVALLAVQNRILQDVWLIKTRWSFVFQKKITLKRSFMIGLPKQIYSQKLVAYNVLSQLQLYSLRCQTFLFRGWRSVRQCEIEQFLLEGLQHASECGIG